MKYLLNNLLVGTSNEYHTYEDQILSDLSHRNSTAMKCTGDGGVLSFMEYLGGRSGGL